VTLAQRPFCNPNATVVGGMSPLPSASRGQTRSRVHLTVLSDSIPPDELSAAIGLPAEESWAKGEPRKGARHLQKFNGVEYASTLGRDQADPDQHVEQLVQRLAPYATNLAKVSDDQRVHSMRLWLYIQTSGENPGFELSHTTLEALGRMGASLAFDLYFIDDL
jgi:hypothetical protein